LDYKYPQDFHEMFHVVNEKIYQAEENTFRNGCGKGKKYYEESPLGINPPGSKSRYQKDQHIKESMKSGYGACYAVENKSHYERKRASSGYAQMEARINYHDQGNLNPDFAEEKQIEERYLKYQQQQG